MFGSGLLDSEGRKFAIKVLDHMRKKLEDYQLESGNIFNLEATPGEGTTHRLARIDKVQYPNIIVANEQTYQERGAAPYYTNSTQLHVASTIDLFDALDVEDELQTKYTGGTVFHTFLGEKINDWKMARELVKRIAHNFKLPYFTLTPTFSVCPVHGYLSGEHELCPKCDEEIGYAGMIRQLNSGKQIDQEILEATKKKRNYCEVYSRVVGYIRPIKQWNAGKYEEYKERRVFDKNL
jgi:ribonucleoside-triphosphate reductase